jgi:hypothetical protein
MLADLKVGLLPLADLDVHRSPLPKGVDAPPASSILSTQHDDHVTDREWPPVEASSKVMDGHDHGAEQERAEEEAYHREEQ